MYMTPELEQRLQTTSREQLIQLLEELTIRHPVLLAEIMGMLGKISHEHEPAQAEEATDDTEEVSEEWDFNGETQVTLRSVPTQQATLPTDIEARHQHIGEFARRLSQVESPQVLFEVLRDLVEDANSYIGQNDDYMALDLFALLIDERLLESRAETVPLFDEMIDAGMYSLEALLEEASSRTMFDTDTVALSPLLSREVRHRWLERLFALWLKRLDGHRVEEDLPELILDVAWSEDTLLLRSLAQAELQKQPHTAHANIVDFGRQYRTKALEKFLKVVSRT
jgi:hypothetical protein